MTLTPSSRFSVLEKSGKAAQFSTSADPGAVQGVIDQEIKEAIRELTRSTETITQQTEILKQQQDALDRLVKCSKKEADARSDLELKHAQKREASQKSTVWAVSTAALTARG